MDRRGPRPKIIILFDINLASEFFEEKRALFAALGIELVFLSREKELAPGDEPPATMEDEDLLRYAEKLLSRKFGRWRKKIKVFLFTADKGFITPIEIRKVPQPDSKEMCVKVLRSIGKEVESHAPGLVERIERAVSSMGE